MLQADEEEMFARGCVVQLCVVYVWGSSCFGCPGLGLEGKKGGRGGNHPELRAGMQPLDGEGGG